MLFSNEFALFFLKLGKKLLWHFGVFAFIFSKPSACPFPGSFNRSLTSTLGSLFPLLQIIGKHIEQQVAHQTAPEHAHVGV